MFRCSKCFITVSFPGICRHVGAAALAHLALCGHTLPQFSQLLLPIAAPPGLGNSGGIQEAPTNPSCQALSCPTTQQLSGRSLPRSRPSLTGSRMCLAWLANWSVLQVSGPASPAGSWPRSWGCGSCRPGSPFASASAAVPERDVALPALSRETEAPLSSRPWGGRGCPSRARLRRGRARQCQTGNSLPLPLASWLSRASSERLMLVPPTAPLPVFSQSLVTQAHSKPAGSVRLTLATCRFPANPTV